MQELNLWPVYGHGQRHIGFGGVALEKGDNRFKWLNDDFLIEVLGREIGEDINDQIADPVASEAGNVDEAIDIE